MQTVIPAFTAWMRSFINNENSNSNPSSKFAVQCQVRNFLFSITQVEASAKSEFHTWENLGQRLGDLLFVHYQQAIRKKKLV